MAYGPEALIEETITDVSALWHFLIAWPVTWVNVDGLGDINVVQALADHHRHPFHPPQLHRRGLRHELRHHLAVEHAGTELAFGLSMGVGVDVRGGSRDASVLLATSLAVKTMLPAGPMPARWRYPSARRWRRWLFRRLYHELAWAYDAISWAVSLGAWDAWRQVVLDYVRGERLLEVGSGTGALLAIATRRGLNPIGLDRSASMLRRSRKRLAYPSQPWRLVQADWRALPFGRATFDTVITTFPTEIILEAAAWHELARVLAPGGRFVAVLTVFAQDPLRRALHRVLDRLLPPDEETIARWHRLPELAQTAGWVVRIERRRVRQALIPVLIATRSQEQTAAAAWEGDTEPEESDDAP